LNSGISRFFANNRVIAIRSWRDITIIDHSNAPMSTALGWTLCTDGLALISSHVFCDYVQRFCLGLSKCVLGSLAHWVSRSTPKFITGHGRSLCQILQLYNYNGWSAEIQVWKIWRAGGFTSWG